MSFEPSDVPEALDCRNESADGVDKFVAAVDAIVVDKLAIVDELVMVVVVVVVVDVVRVVVVVGFNCPQMTQRH